MLETVLDLHGRVLSTLLSLIDFFRTKSPLACVTYELIYVATSLLCLPLTPIEIFTGFCYGVPFGIVLDIIGRIVGAVLSFTIARALSRQGSGCSSLRAAAVLRGVGQAVEEQGLRFLVLFNLACVPVAVKNYGLGFVPEVPLPLFVAAIFMIEIPMASIWATIGSVVAGDLEAAGVSSSNASVAGAAIASGPAKAGWQLKLSLLVVGVVSILLVLHSVHGKVAVQLKRLSDDAGDHWLLSDGQ